MFQQRQQKKNTFRTEEKREKKEKRVLENMKSSAKKNDLATSMIRNSTDCSQQIDESKLTYEELTSSNRLFDVLGNSRNDALVVRVRRLFERIVNEVPGYCAYQYLVVGPEANHNNDIIFRFILTLLRGYQKNLSLRHPLPVLREANLLLFRCFSSEEADRLDDDLVEDELAKSSEFVNSFMAPTKHSTIWSVLDCLNSDKKSVMKEMIASKFPEDKVSHFWDLMLQVADAAVWRNGESKEPVSIGSFVEELALTLSNLSAESHVTLVVNVSDGNSDHLVPPPYPTVFLEENTMMASRMFDATMSTMQGSGVEAPVKIENDENVVSLILGILDNMSVCLEGGVPPHANELLTKSLCASQNLAYNYQSICANIVELIQKINHDTGKCDEAFPFSAWIDHAQKLETSLRILTTSNFEDKTVPLVQITAFNLSSNALFEISSSWPPEKKEGLAVYGNMLFVNNCVLLNSPRYNLKIASYGKPFADCLKHHYIKNFDIEIRSNSKFWFSMSNANSMLKQRDLFSPLWNGLPSSLLSKMRHTVQSKFIGIQTNVISRVYECYPMIEIIRRSEIANSFLDIKLLLDGYSSDITLPRPIPPSYLVSYCNLMRSTTITGGDTIISTFNDLHVNLSGNCIANLIYQWSRDKSILFNSFGLSHIVGIHHRLINSFWNGKINEYLKDDDLAECETFLRSSLEVLRNMLTASYQAVESIPANPRMFKKLIDLTKEIYSPTQTILLNINTINALDSLSLLSNLYRSNNRSIVFVSIDPASIEKLPELFMNHIFPVAFDEKCAFLIVFEMSPTFVSLLKRSTLKHGNPVLQKIEVDSAEQLKSVSFNSNKVKIGWEETLSTFVDTYEHNSIKECKFDCIEHSAISLLTNALHGTIIDCRSILKARPVSVNGANNVYSVDDVFIVDLMDQVISDMHSSAVDICITFKTANLLIYGSFDEMAEKWNVYEAKIQPQDMQISFPCPGEGTISRVDVFNSPQEFYNFFMNFLKPGTVLAGNGFFLRKVDGENYNVHFHYDIDPRLALRRSKDKSMNNYFQDICRKKLPVLSDEDFDLAICPWQLQQFQYLFNVFPSRPKAINELLKLMTLMMYAGLHEDQRPTCVDASYERKAVEYLNSSMQPLREHYMWLALLLSVVLKKISDKAIGPRIGVEKDNIFGIEIESYIREAMADRDFCNPHRTHFLRVSCDWKPSDKASKLKNSLLGRMLVSVLSKLKSDNICTNRVQRILITGIESITEKNQIEYLCGNANRTRSSLILKNFIGFPMMDGFDMELDDTTAADVEVNLENSDRSFLDHSPDWSELQHHTSDEDEDEDEDKFDNNVSIPSNEKIQSLFKLSKSALNSFSTRIDQRLQLCLNDGIAEGAILTTNGEIIKSLVALHIPNDANYLNFKKDEFLLSTIVDKSVLSDEFSNFFEWMKIMSRSSLSLKLRQMIFNLFSGTCDFINESETVTGDQLVVLWSLLQKCPENSKTKEYKNRIRDSLMPPSLFEACRRDKDNGVFFAQNCNICKTLRKSNVRYFELDLKDPSNHEQVVYFKIRKAIQDGFCFIIIYEHDGISSKLLKSIAGIANQHIHTYVYFICRVGKYDFLKLNSDCHPQKINLDEHFYQYFETACGIESKDEFDG